MRRTWTIALLGAALCAPAFCAEGDLPLTEGPARAQALDAIFWARKQVRATKGKAASIKGTPKTAGTVYCGNLKLGGRQVDFLLDLAASPKLYFDTDGDSDLTDEEPVAGMGRGGSSETGFWGSLFGVSSEDPREEELSFEPFTVRLTNPEAEVKLSVRSDWMDGERIYLRLSPAVRRSCLLRLGNRSYNVELLDANLDGRYDSVFKPTAWFDCDAMTIDLNSNGRIDGSYMNFGEVLPLPKMVQLGDAYYKLSVADDGLTVRFDAVEPVMGTLNLGTTEADVQLLSDCGSYWLKGAQERHELPEGRYAVVNVKLSRRDAQKALWSLESDWPSGTLRDFAVQREGTTVLAMGPPLHGKVDLRGGGRSVSIQYSIIGQAGETYGSGALRNGRQQAAPRLKILAEDGKVLASGSFQYG